VASKHFVKSILHNTEADLVLMEKAPIAVINYVNVTSGKWKLNGHRHQDNAQDETRHAW
jgi:hypothetical protein